MGKSEMRLVRVVDDSSRVIDDSSTSGGRGGWGGTLEDIHRAHRRPPRPLGSVVSYHTYADVRAFRCLIAFLKPLGTAIHQNAQTTFTCRSRPLASPPGMETALRLAATAGRRRAGFTFGTTRAPRWSTTKPSKNGSSILTVRVVTHHNIQKLHVVDESV